MTTTLTMTMIMRNEGRKRIFIKNITKMMVTMMRITKMTNNDGYNDDDDEADNNNDKENKDDNPDDSADMKLSQIEKLGK
jgi:hypothetical protein